MTTDWQSFSIKKIHELNGPLVESQRNRYNEQKKKGKKRNKQVENLTVSVLLTHCQTYIRDIFPRSRQKCIKDIPDARIFSV